MRLLFCVSICRDDRWATQDDNDFYPLDVNLPQAEVDEIGYSVPEVGEK